MAEIGHGTRRLNPSDRDAEIAITIFFCRRWLAANKEGRGFLILGGLRIGLAHVTTSTRI
jgi:hypothetical protein